jgi:demethylmenaquinone methyltransferase/2-methoxy-6-polyprenyl-1,4-benzoquinol methylase
MTADSLETYYSRRAHEYENIYQKPERQSDLAQLKEVVCTLFSGHTVLEVACGTGYWTQVVAKTAEFVTATDISSEVLEIARQKPVEEGKVEFLKNDAYGLAQLAGPYTAALAAFWWSHVPREKVEQFLRSFHHSLAAGSLVMLIDNKYVPGNSTPITSTDESCNTYQLRKLSDGTEYRVLKNFPGEVELQRSLGVTAKSFCFHELTYYWYATYFVHK